MMFRYYVRLLPKGKPLQCPSTRGMLMDLYFTTIERLTGIDFVVARKMIEGGEVIQTPECEFWAVSIMENVIVIPGPVESAE